MKRRINVRKIFLMISDALIVALSKLISNALISLYGIITRTGTDDIAVKPIRIFIVIGLNVILCFFMMYVFGAYSKMWRELRKSDLAICALSIALGLGMSFTFLWLVERPATVPFMIINLIITVLAIVLFRIAFRRTFDDLVKVADSDKRERTLIVGAGNAARMIIQEIINAESDENNAARNINPVCLVDDDINKFNTKLLGVDVVGTTKDIPEVCKRYNIALVIFAIPSCTEDERKRIMGYCSDSGCRIKTIPYISQLLLDDDAPNILSQVKDIRIEDLLGRPPITFDKTKIRNFIEHKVCMVTGGGGSIGSELVRQIAKYNPEQIIIVDIYENNAYDIQQELYLEYEDRLNLVTLIASVRDYKKMEQIFSEYKPQVVFHAAAHKHVPLMEVSPAEAVKNNIFGTWNMVTLAEFYHVEKFVMISTDKAVNPTNVMGATKRC